MKKIMLVAALGVSALFTACGDDSSSAKGSDTSCSVDITDSSVTKVTVYGETTTETWLFRGDSIVYTLESDDEDLNGGEPSVMPKGDETVNSIKVREEKACKETEALWERMDEELDKGGVPGAGGPSCEVKVAENSAQAIQTIPGDGVYTTTWILENDSVRTEYSDLPEHNTARPAESVTADTLASYAKQNCKLFENGLTK